uniref:DUF551 domain-containing protein n=1 Tax=Ascaris lumbricoides TaxID=6252 RepID=A0A0M3HLL7_ASCLU
MDYFDPEETSWMWGWIKGNQKWHAWNKCKDRNIKFSDEFVKFDDVEGSS